MTPDDAEKLTDLVAYLSGWQAAQAAWHAWIDREYAARLAAWTVYRTQARDKISANLDQLPYDKRGGVNPGSAQKWKFRNATDRILGATVLRGEELFGIDGQRNDAGIYVGTLNKQTASTVTAALRDTLKLVPAL